MITVTPEQFRFYEITEGSLKILKPIVCGTGYIEEISAGSIEVNGKLPGHPTVVVDKMILNSNGDCSNLLKQPSSRIIVFYRDENNAYKTGYANVCFCEDLAEPQDISFSKDNEIDIQSMEYLYDDYEIGHKKIICDWSLNELYFKKIPVTTKNGPDNIIVGPPGWQGDYQSSLVFDDHISSFLRFNFDDMTYKLYKNIDIPADSLEKLVDDLSVVGFSFDNSEKLAPF